VQASITMAAELLFKLVVASADPAALFNQLNIRSMMFSCRLFGQSAVEVAPAWSCASWFTAESTGCIQ